MVESERGWGQEYWVERFETAKAREARKNEIKRKNVGPTPDWYISYTGEFEEDEIILAH